MCHRHVGRTINFVYILPMLNPVYYQCISDISQCPKISPRLVSCVPIDYSKIFNTALTKISWGVEGMGSILKRLEDDNFRGTQKGE